MLQRSVTAPLHLRPATTLAERVLLPADPHSALFVAQALLDGPKMFNHARGLWGYTGVARDGEPLSVQATGLGGPSAAVVCEELIELGAHRLVGIGTAEALDDTVPVGSLLAAGPVLALDGAGARLAGAGARLEPDPELHGRLIEAGASPAAVASTDLFYDHPAQVVRESGQAATAVDLQAAAILGVAARRGVAAACLVGVATGLRDPEALEALSVRLGEAGYAALRIP